MHRRKRWRTLRFEVLETRVLLAADVFAAFEAPVTDLCVASYCDRDVAPAGSRLQPVAGEQVVHVNISDADRGSTEDIAISDLAFAKFGSEVSAGQPLD